MRWFEFLKKWPFYTTVSVTKIFLWFVILLLTLSQLNIKEDPEIALTFLLIGVLVFAWGVSYFVFYGGQLLFLLNTSVEKMQKDAYKSSFLFGLYALINMLLVIGGLRGKWIWLFFLFLFIAMQWMIFTVKKDEHHDY